jgi:hypothetical protein
MDKRKMTKGCSDILYVSAHATTVSGRVPKLFFKAFLVKLDLQGM